MDEQHGLAILQRVQALDVQITVEIEAFTQEVQPVINGLEASLQGEVNALTEALEQLGNDFREQLATRLQQKLGVFTDNYLQPAGQALDQIEGVTENLDETVKAYIEQLTQPIDNLLEWEKEIEDQIDELKEKVTGAIETQAEQFIEATTETSDAMFELLQEQLQNLAQWLEQWVNDLTVLGDKQLQQALQANTKELTDRITEGIDRLLATLLERFDHYIQLAKQALLDAVSQGSATREAVEPALEQLEMVRKMIEVVVDQVKSLAEKVGVPLPV